MRLGRTVRVSTMSPWCLLVMVVVVMAAMVEGLIVEVAQTPLPSHHIDFENCSIWLSEIPYLPLLPYHLSTTPPAATSPQPSQLLATEAAQPPATAPPQLPAVRFTQLLPSSVTQPHLNTSLPKMAPPVPTTVTQPTSAKVAKLPVFSTNLIQPPPVKRSGPPRPFFALNTITGLPPRSSAPQPPTMRVHPSLQSTTPILQLSPPIINILPLSPSLPAMNTQLPAPATVTITPPPPTTTTASSSASSVSVEMWENLHEVLGRKLPRLFDPQVSELFHRPYFERLKIANHEMGDKILQEPLPTEEEGEQESEVRCPLRQREERLAQLQQVVSLLLSTLPQSLADVQEVALNPELAIYFFRPEMKAVLDVSSCRQCYAVDHRGDCRQLFFCKGGQSVASRKKLTQADLLRLYKG